jgi:hypothetical protein
VTQTGHFWLSLASQHELKTSDARISSGGSTSCFKIPIEFSREFTRTRIEETHTRPLLDRTLRALLAWLVPHPNRFRLALAGAWFGRPFARLLPGRLGAMLALAPRAAPARMSRSGPSNDRVWPDNALSPNRRRPARARRLRDSMI